MSDIDRPTYTWPRTNLPEPAPMSPTDRLDAGIAVLQRFGRRGTIVADQILNEEPYITKEDLLDEVAERLKGAPPEMFE